jgi:release factor glutamine methyltransferase
MTLSTTISRALARSGLVPLDAQVLLAHVVGRDRGWLVAHGDETLTAEQTRAFDGLARRRRAGEPVAHLTGTREFWGLSFRVSPAVLIPRPETETLVELALASLPVERDVAVLDLGTGSGAIAIAIAHERSRARVLATDVSPAALAIARENATRIGVANVEFIESDWFDRLEAEVPDARFDLIASNPPYVAGGDPHLGDGDVRFEPLRALAAGADGLDAIRHIAANAARWLVPGGSLVIEHGFDQSARVLELFVAAGFSAIASARDLAGIPRVVAGTLASALRDAQGPRD